MIFPWFCVFFFYWVFFSKFWSKKKLKNFFFGFLLRYTDDLNIIFQYFTQFNANLVKLSADAIQKLAMADGKVTFLFETLAESLSIQQSRLETIQKKLQFFTDKGFVAEGKMMTEITRIHQEVAQFGLWNPETMEKRRLPENALTAAVLTEDMAGNLRNFFNVIEAAVGQKDLDIKKSLDCLSVDSLTTVRDDCGKDRIELFPFPALSE